MPIELAEVRRIAALARLDLDEATLARMSGQLARILEYVVRLEEAGASDCDNGESGAEPFSIERLREDRPAPTLGADRATTGAPEAALGEFRVPRILASDAADG